MEDRKDYRLIVTWLVTGCILIAAMVVIGGITRLTQSGLSIVEWDLIKGTVAPTSEAGWQEMFEKYKESPQFKLINHDFTLEDFKSIFWWEYIHRLLGRIIGVIFIIPFIIFLFRRSIPNDLLPKLIIIFLLGALQGALGWFMVKSGLVNEPRVSHYRLAAHLLTAFITFGYTMHVALSLTRLERFSVRSPIKNWFTFTFVLLCLQIIYGAFVAGTRAGYLFNSWPKMNGSWIHEAVPYAFSNLGLAALTESPAAIQFIHRTLAIIVFLLFIWLVILAYKKAKSLVRLSWTILGLGILQLLLGIYTLVLAVPVSLGVFHQLGAFLLFATFVYANWAVRKI